MSVSSDVREGCPVAVVTGGARGIGRAIATEYAAAGYAVAVTARNVDTLKEVVEVIEDKGGTALAVECDVTDATSMTAAAAEVGYRLGQVHTVVANAGISGPTAPLHEVDPADWRGCMVTNVDGVFLTFRAFIPAVIVGGCGSLIAVSSMTGKRPLFGRTPYAASKMAVIGLVRTLALELGPHGIRVNTVCPGAVNGPRLENVLRSQAEARGITFEEAHRVFTDASPLGRLVEAAEVARTCTFLSSDAALSITGEDINVNAGAAMY